MQEAGAGVRRRNLVLADFLDTRKRKHLVEITL